MTAISSIGIGMALRLATFGCEEKGNVSVKIFGLDQVGLDDTLVEGNRAVKLN